MFVARFLDNGIIDCSGRLDAAEADKADGELKKITTTSTLDLKNLDYISSAGLGVLLKAHKRLMATGGRLSLMNVNHHIFDIFRFSGFDQLFDIKRSDS